MDGCVETGKVVGYAEGMLHPQPKLIFVPTHLGASPPQAVSLAIEKLSTVDLRPVEKVHLGRSYGIPTWLKEGYVALIGDRSEDTTFEEMTSLGFETVSRILWARDRVFSRPPPNGFWVGKDSFACGNCWKAKGQMVPIRKATYDWCGVCGHGYSVGVTVINSPYNSLSNAPSSCEATKDPYTGWIIDKVNEVFKGEIDDAERKDSYPEPA